MDKKITEGRNRYRGREWMNEWKIHLNPNMKVHIWKCIIFSFFSSSSRFLRSGNQSVQLQREITHTHALLLAAHRFVESHHDICTIYNKIIRALFLSLFSLSLSFSSTRFVFFLLPCFCFSLHFPSRMEHLARGQILLLFSLGHTTTEHLDRCMFYIAHFKYFSFFFLVSPHVGVFSLLFLQIRSINLWNWLKI